MKKTKKFQGTKNLANKCSDQIHNHISMSNSDKITASGKQLFYLYILSLIVGRITLVL